MMLPAMKRTALITGGTGFLGSRLCSTLAEAGWRAVAADINPPAEPIQHAFLRLDVRDPGAVQFAVEQADVVIDNAAHVPLTRSTPAVYRSVNVAGTGNVLGAAQKAGIYVAHISSSAIYGVPRELPVTPTTRSAPFEAYGASKAEAEQLVDAARADGLTVSSLRPRTLVGPGRLGIFDTIVSRVAKGKTVPLFGRGDNLLQLLDVDDMCAAVIRAIETQANDNYNIGAAEYGTVRADLEALISHAGTGARVLGLPEPALRAILRSLDAVGLSPFTAWHYGTADRPFYYDISKAVDELGWRPQKSNVQMLIDHYEWYVHAPSSGPAGSVHLQPLQGTLARLLRE
jgi:nucleoside-diphosphate-sugar epimerase